MLKKLSCQAFPSALQFIFLAAVVKKPFPNPCRRAGGLPGRRLG